MALHHPYSFSDPADSTVTRSRRRSFELSDERGRVVAGDSEAPATARDSDIERRESRAPLLIAGVTSAVLLGGVLVALGFVSEPRLSPTVETETIPRQAALLEKLDAEALERARVAIRGVAPTMPAQAETAPMEATSVDATSVEDTGPAPMSVDPATEPTGNAPMSPEPEPAPAQEEPLMTPAPSMTAPSVVLDRDNPYTSESEGDTDAPGAQAPATPHEAHTSDNPY